MNEFHLNLQLRRNVDTNYVLCEDKLESVRTDAYHYPNVLGVNHNDHFQDYRSG